MTNIGIHTHTLQNRTLFVRFLLVGLFAVFFLVPKFSQAEEIRSFHSDIDVSSDGTFVVTENIEYVFTEDRHGIFREIPLTHPDGATHFLKRRIVDIDLVAVGMDGEEVPYSLESSRDLFKIRIGDPDTFVSGVHTYTITYTVGGGLSYPKNEPPELYFNVTGNGWEVPIMSAQATVHAPDGMFRAERACYVGLEGARGSCTITQIDGTTIQFGTTQPLGIGDGMTIAQAFDYTKIATDIREQVKIMWFVIPLSLLGVLWAAMRTYRYKTEYKTDAPIIAQYEPYAGVKPMYAGILFDRRLDPQDVTAGIVHLAREGYIKIRHTERKVLFLFEVDDYELTLTRSARDLNGAFERQLLHMLFDDAETAVGKTLSLHDLKNNHAEAQENFKLLQELQTSLREDLKAQDFIAGFDFKKIFNRRFMGGLIVGAVLIAWISSIALTFFIVTLIVILIVVADGRRTRKGYEALDHLLGFKEFLSVTEKERYAFHNAPKLNVEQFMEYLPYAIAFGVEKEWAKAFEGITIPSPDWYDGGSGMHAFSAVGMTESIGAFSTALASSGASASSGGGSSGGGSGGGGGGSW